MKEGFRQSMAWLHTWSGLLVCWILLLIFSAGTATYYKEEIGLWMQPELHGAAQQSVPAIAASELAVQALQQRAPKAERWFVTLPTERAPAIRIMWTAPKKPDGAGEKPRRRRGLESAMLDPVTGAELDKPRATRGGEFFYRLHFDLHYMPALWARWIVGFCAMFMLVSIVSGVITHKRIFKDFFTFRPAKGQRSWLDAHNATAVLALPYHLMITYTGLVTLMFMYIPSGMQVSYKEDNEAFSDIFLNVNKPVKASGTAAPLAPLRPMLEQAERRWEGKHVGGFSVNHPNDANAVVSFTRAAGRDLSSKQPTMRFDGATGTLQGGAGDEQSASSSTHGVMYGLHLGRFAGTSLRALFFLSGLAGCAMVATGVLLWAVKSRQKQARQLKAGARLGFGTRLVEALNNGAIAGLPIAYACYFRANRLLPVDMARRQENEIAAFFAAWGAAALLAQLRPDRAMWRLQLGAGAVLLAAVPLLNGLTGGSHLGDVLLHGRGSAAVAGFDLTVMALGLLLGYASWRLGRGGARRSAAPAGAATTTTATTAATTTTPAAAREAT